LPQAIEIAENLRSRLAAQPFDTGKDRTARMQGF